MDEPGFDRTYSVDNSCIGFSICCYSSVNSQSRKWVKELYCDECTYLEAEFPFDDACNGCIGRGGVVGNHSKMHRVEDKS